MASAKPGSPDNLNLDELRELFYPHIESFDHLIDAGLETIFRSINLKSFVVTHPSTSKKLIISLEKPALHPPQKEGVAKSTRQALYPFECRQAKLTYSGRFSANVCFQYEGDATIVREPFSFGQFPIMLKSKRCNLRGASPRKLVSLKEEASEMGGYFIVNGFERYIRPIIMPKRNYPMSTVRSSFSEKREGYTDKAVVIRCVRADQTSLTVKLYYLRNGSARLGFWIRGREYMLPVGILLKALIDTTDREIYVNLTSCYNEKYEKGKGAVGTQLVGERAKIILDEVRDLSLFTRLQCLQYIGEHFQPMLRELRNESHYTVANAVLKDFILVHLDDNFDKFNLLIFMLQKLFSLIDQTSVPDNPDSLQNQEVLLPGHLITLYLKAKLEEWLEKGKMMLLDEIEKKGEAFNFDDFTQVKRVLVKNHANAVSKAIESMLTSGRLATSISLDLPQVSGYTLQAERLNYLRFLSHFRAVHRGALFAGFRTTTVRKLLPESWGFLCPVHTPDGGPCGLLNHMTCTCRITSFYDSQGNIKDYFKLNCLYSTY